MLADEVQQFWATNILASALSFSVSESISCISFLVTPPIMAWSASADILGTLGPPHVSLEAFESLLAPSPLLLVGPVPVPLPLAPPAATITVRYGS